MDFDLDSIWDMIIDAPSNGWESIIGIFENISEFSITGLVFGILCTLLIIFLSQWTLQPFLIHMNFIEGLIIQGLTYLSCFIGGYLLGVHFENS
jgi:hypothetical protein